jgi:hypothetical protein
MSVSTVVAIVVVAGLGAAQYILAIQALRDLVRRPRVRGDNKVAWGLFILCVPIVGALVYGWMGPTSLIRRAAHPGAPSRPVAPRRQPDGRSAARRKITPISEARHREQSPPPAPAADGNPVRRFRRTGS